MVVEKLLYNNIRFIFNKSINLIPDLIEVCDIVHIYDNTVIPFRIFKAL